jgi:hypothetical protein
VASARSIEIKQRGRNLRDRGQAARGLPTPRHPRPAGRSRAKSNRLSLRD